MSGTIKIIQSVKESNTFWEESQKRTLKLTQAADILVDSSQTFQTWLGFGGAVTEASAYNLNKVSKENKDKILQAYYHPTKGLGYTHGRVHINSSDFSLGNYDYVEQNDETLKSFSIKREEKYVLPILHEINKLTEKPLQLLASPWSPPGWMKTNGEMNNGGKLKKKYYTLWAEYFVNYIQSMKERGVGIWSVSIQNEPAAKQVWDSCLYTAEEEREFVKYLSKAFKEADLEDIKIIIWDHNRDILFERVDGVLSDPVANQAVWGVGNHWYMSEEFEQLAKVKDKYPDKHMIFTEGCIEGGVQLGAWHTGERYARNIIGDMNNWLEAFIDWNIVLNEIGGPNHVGNYCDAPVIVNTKSDTVHFKCSYYAIGHFSKYIKAGAKRVGLKVSDSSLRSVAFRNTDGSVVSVVLNETSEEKQAICSIDGEGVRLELPAHSITTLVKEKESYIKRED